MLGLRANKCDSNIDKLRDWFISGQNDIFELK